jgi:hypothetical protein
VTLVCSGCKASIGRHTDKGREEKYFCERAVNRRSSAPCLQPTPPLDPFSLTGEDDTRRDSSAMQWKEEVPSAAVFLEQRENPPCQRIMLA